MSDINHSSAILDNREVSSRDQRKRTRFRPEEAETFLLLEGNRIPGEIVDEPYDGVGVLASERLDFQVDDSIELVYYDVPVCGIVRSVSQQGSQTRLGIQWSRRRKAAVSDRPRCRTESEFFFLSGIPVACRVVDKRDGVLIARLPDRKEVEVAPEEVRVINRFQRLADLKEADKELRVLGAFYQLGALQSHDDLLREVLNLEFAPTWD